MRGGGLKPGETPNQTKWFKEGAFFDSLQETENLLRNG